MPEPDAPTSLRPGDLRALRQALIEMESYRPEHYGAAPRPRPAARSAPQAPVEPDLPAPPQRGGGWSAIALGMSVLAFGAAAAGATTSVNLKIVNTLFGSTLIWLGLGCLLLLLAIGVARLHLVTRAAIGLICVIGLALAAPAVLAKVPPSTTDEIVTSPLGLEAVSQRTGDAQRWAVVVQQTDPDLREDLRSNRFVLGCLTTRTSADRLVGLYWVGLNQLSIQLADQRNATVTVSPVGSVTGVTDPSSILRQPGTFGC